MLSHLERCATRGSNCYGTVCDMLRPNALPLFALATLALSLPGSVAATSCTSSESVYRGFLAGSLRHETLEVPRNVAVFDVALRETEHPLEFVPLVELALDGLSRPEVPFAPNTAIRTHTGTESWDRKAITTTEIDSQPPTPVQLLGVSRGGCLGAQHVYVDLEEPPSDDQTPANQLAYAVYGGSTAEEAEASPQPEGIWMGPYLSFYSKAEWVAISVLDLAGNESPRSKAEVVSRPSTSACAASEAKPAASPATVLALLLCAWAGVRTIRRRA